MTMTRDDFFVFISMITKGFLTVIPGGCSHFVPSNSAPEKPQARYLSDQGSLFEIFPR